MDLTKQTLEGAQFRSRGKWYLAEQVDTFLEALKASVEEDCREEEQAAREAQRLKEENTALRNQNKDYSLLRKVFGSRQIDNLVAQAREAQQAKRRQRQRSYDYER